MVDSDKVGKDNSLGSLSLDITEVLALHGQTGEWFLLSGVKSGKVLLSGDFLDDLRRKPSDILPGLSKGVDSNGFGNGKYSSDSPRNNQLNSNLPSGKAKLNLIKTKDMYNQGRFDRES